MNCPKCDDEKYCEECFRKEAALMKVEYDAGRLNPPACDGSDDCGDTECQECCPHDEHDHGICMDCGLDRNDHFVGMAEAAFEGDR